MGASGSAPDRSAQTGSSTKLGFSWGVGETQGRRPTMEDAFVATCFGEQGGWEDMALFGVFDGHGGAQVAKFCAEHLPQVLTQGDSSRASAVLRDSFLHVDEMLADVARRTPPSDPGHPDNTGCTAVVSLVSPHNIVVANAGDSRAVLSRNGRAVALSQDHKPNLPKEAARIHKAGGFISQQRCGPRDVVHRVNGKLALSRSLGDLNFKKNSDLEAGEQLVSCVPDIKTFRRQSDDEFMVIACDGIWDVMTSQQVVDRIQKDLTLIRYGYLQPDMAVRKILDECLATDPAKNYGRGADNMTMILIVFNKGGGVPTATSGMLTTCLHPTKALVKRGDCTPLLKSVKSIVTDNNLSHNREASPVLLGDKRCRNAAKCAEKLGDAAQNPSGTFAIQSKMEK